jgi:acyl-CoA thioester hydrolase
MDSGTHRLELRVRYSETDQMGVVYHSHYLVWCDAARTDLLKSLGANYRDLERSGLRLAVTEACVKFRSPATYDDLVAVRCWIRGLTRRTIEFGYVIERATDTRKLATARTTLIALDNANALSTIPQEVREKLAVVQDPVRL